MKIRVQIIILAGLLSACTSIAPVKYKNQETAPATTREHLLLADDAMTRVRKGYSSVDIDKAIYHYGIALKTHPENIIIQELHYRALFIRDRLSVGSTASTHLIDSHKNLNWLIKKTLNPPGYVNYLKEVDDKKSATRLIPLMQKLIFQQPDNAYLWNALSELYDDNKQYWLAVAAAKMANQLNKDVPKYMYQLGDSINNVIQSQDCRFDEKEYAKSAVKYIARAAAKQPNQLYFDNTGLQYMHLGLFPIAYQSSKKAYDLEKNEWTILHFIDASLLTHRYKEAKEAANHYASIVDKDAIESYAMISASEGNLGAAAEIMQKINHSSDGVLVELRTRWLHELAGTKYIEKDIQSLVPKGRWQASISAYFKQSSSNEVRGPQEQLVSTAKNGCQRTEAYFYTAYSYWKQQKKDKAIEYLKLVEQQTATRYTEYLWAGILKNQL